MKNEKLTILSGNPLKLGVTKTERGYNFAFCSDADSVVINLYVIGEKEPSYSIELTDVNRIGSVFCVELSGLNFAKYEYIYVVDDMFVSDPYAKYITNGKDFGLDMSDEQYRCGIVSGEFEWGEDTFLNTKFSDMIIYKLHTRGFTKHKSSRVSRKGTFAGIVEKLPYLKELGINAIMIMPPFEFYEYRKSMESSPYANVGVKKINYWGYTGGLYFAPKYAYCKNSKATDYTVEFKKLVKTMHENGIEVLIELYFGAEASNSLIVDCVKNWVLEYHVDGINLCCEKDVFASLANEPVLSKTKLFSNYWNDSMTKKNAKNYKNLANLNDGFMVNARRFLKSDEDMLRSFVASLKNNPSNAANINYLTNHAGFTLNDLVSFDRKHNEENGENSADGSDYNYSWNCGVEGKTRKKKVLQLRHTQIKNAWLLLLLAQGTPMIMSGDEFLNSTSGNNNPYCQDNEISWLNWKGLDANKEIYEFVRKVIAFRNEHKILHMDEEMLGSDYMSYGFPDVSYHSENAWFAKMETYNRHLGVLYCGKYANADELIYVAYNMHWEQHELALPNVSDVMKFEGILESVEGSYKIDEDNRVVNIAPRSIAVLVAKVKEKGTEKKVKGNRKK